VSKIVERFAQIKLQLHLTGLPDYCPFCTGATRNNNTHLTTQTMEK
jgi:hypothetical protein